MVAFPAKVWRLTGDTRTQTFRTGGPLSCTVTVEACSGCMYMYVTCGMSRIQMGMECKIVVMCTVVTGGFS